MERTVCGLSLVVVLVVAYDEHVFPDETLHRVQRVVVVSFFLHGRANTPPSTVASDGTGREGGGPSLWDG